MNARCVDAAYNYATDLSPKISIPTPQSTRGGAFYVNNAASITSSANRIYNCYVCDQGGAYSIISSSTTTFTDTNSFYYDTAALQGGAIYAQGAQMTMTNVDVRNLYASNGGVFYGVEVANLNVQSSAFFNNNAIKNGGLGYFLSQKDPNLP